MKSFSAPLSPQLSSEDKACDADPGDEVLLEDADVNNPDDGMGPRGGHDEEEGYADFTMVRLKWRVTTFLMSTTKMFVIDADRGETAQLPRPIPPPPVPSDVVIRCHQLTHMPYHS